MNNNVSPMNSKVCIIRDENSENLRVKVLTPGVLVRVLTSRLKRENIVFKRKDVIQFANDYVSQFNGLSIDFKVFESDMNDIIRVFDKYSTLTIMELRGMMKYFEDEISI